MRAGGTQFKHVVPSNNTTLCGANVRISHAQQRCKNNMKVIPATADRIEKREKHNKYILATHGPLSRFAVRIGHVPPQNYVKHYAPSGSKFLRIPGTPLL